MAYSIYLKAFIALSQFVTLLRAHLTVILLFKLVQYHVVLLVPGYAARVSIFPPFIGLLTGIPTWVVLEACSEKLRGYTSIIPPPFSYLKADFAYSSILNKNIP